MQKQPTTDIKLLRKYLSFIDDLRLYGKKLGFGKSTLHYKNI